MASGIGRKQRDVPSELAGKASKERDRERINIYPNIIASDRRTENVTHRTPFKHNVGDWVEDSTSYLRSGTRRKVDDSSSPNSSLVTDDSDEEHQISRKVPPVQTLLQPQSKSRVTFSSVFVISVCALSVFAALLAAFIWYSGASIDVERLDAEVKQSIKEMEKSFPSQGKSLWLKAYSAVLTVLLRKPTQPRILLLLYSGDDMTSNCLVSQMAERASQYLHVEKRSPIILDASDPELNKSFLENNNSFIEDYRRKVEDQGTMVVKNLHSLPSIIAEKLHFFCDEYEPLVPKAVYLFTMQVPNPQQGLTAAAEAAFKELWGKVIDADTLGPLITRLTSEVDFVKSEANVPC